jgi:DNA-binding transcriptional MerR regulator
MKRKFSDKHTEQLIAGMLHKRFRVADFPIGSRVLQHWKKERLLFPAKKNRNGKRTWVRYDFIEMCWLRTVFELRKLGTPFNTIRLIKANLFNLSGKKGSGANEIVDNSIRTLFGRTLLDTIIKRQNNLLFLNLKGVVISIRLHDLPKALQDKGFRRLFEKPHFTVSIGNILATQFETQFSSQDILIKAMLSATETQVASMLNDKKAKEIKVKVRNRNGRKVVDEINIISIEAFIFHALCHNFESFKLKRIIGKTVYSVANKKGKC